MQHGYLSEYFRGCVVKRLTAVEADTARSNQHEFNGVSDLKRLFGESKLEKLPTRFLWLGDEQEVVSEEGFLTWYDAREQHPTRSEYRLYFPTTTVSEKSVENDVLFIARRADNEGAAMVIVASENSTSVNQLLWLFGISSSPEDSFVLSDTKASPRNIDFAVRFVLEDLGVEVEEPEEDLEQWVAEYGSIFPSTRVFSERARESLPDVDPRDSPDDALLSWMEREEAMFRYMEKQIVSSKLESGFQIKDGSPDIDGFIKFSLSVQNRRKSRAGYALENHLEAIFQANSIRYVREAVTENRSKPDFLFPGASEYHDMNFPTAKLTMLGAKSSCKDRWRQVLTEAVRINKKHLLTLEPGISEMQTDEMRSNNLQLVLPKLLHSTYHQSQRDWLMDVEEFIAFTLMKN